MKHHFVVLEEKLFSEFYAEIELMEPVFRYLLAAQQRGKAKVGMSSLRQSAATGATSARIPSADLDEYPRQFYEWLDPQKRSTIRLCIHGQAFMLEVS